MLPVAQRDIHTTAIPNQLHDSALLRYVLTPVMLNCPDACSRWMLSNPRGGQRAQLNQPNDLGASQAASSRVSPGCVSPGVCQLFNSTAAYLGSPAPVLSMNWFALPLVKTRYRVVAKRSSADSVALPARWTFEGAEVAISP